MPRDQAPVFQLTPWWIFALPRPGRHLHLFLVVHSSLMGTALDWGKALRDYRARTGLNQQGLAAQLGISQPQISRIEAGSARLADDVASAVRALIQKPGNRGLFDGLLTTIQFCPHVACLVQPAGDDIRYVALSRGFREHPQFRAIEIGQLVRKQASRNGEALVLATIGSGIFDGDVTSINAIWKAEVDDQLNHWQGVMTPIRASGGGWYLHCAMKPLSPAQFAALSANRSDPMVVHRLN